jgi:hypothetical protein
MDPPAAQEIGGFIAGRLPIQITETLWRCAEAFVCENPAIQNFVLVP